MASERLVAQAKNALSQHYQARPRPLARASGGTNENSLAMGSAYDSEAEVVRAKACVWAHEFVQLLADYDFTLGGSSRRDSDVRAWVEEVEGSETREGCGAGVGHGSASSNVGDGSGGQDPAVPSSDPTALSLVRTNSEDSEISVEDGWEDMNRYMAVPHWDYLVDRIHRVERSEVTGEIMVYFTSRHGEKIKETARLCKARLPKKLLAFYEENLRWDNNVVNGHY